MVTQSRHFADLPPANPVLLTDVSAGVMARVTEIAGHCEDALRLKALGVCSGRTVQVAAAGDPLIVRVAGARVGVSARLAQQVSVVPQLAPPAAAR
ncbi:MAG: hypothetical protein CMJ58_16690 [Planctomycetaceae bacterium]|nr:hypothetical protein [Planctomycetaceae bacterium]